MDQRNLLLVEYERTGAKPLRGKSQDFANLVWERLGVQEDASVNEATIEAGINDPSDDEIFYPAIDALLSAGLLDATTRLYRDRGRQDAIPNSDRTGVLATADYDDKTLAELGVTKGTRVYSDVFVRLAGPLAKKAGASEAASPSAKEEEEVSSPLTEEMTPLEPGDESEPSAGAEASSQGSEDESSHATTNVKGRHSDGSCFRSNTLGTLVFIVGKGDRPKTSRCTVYDDPKLSGDGRLLVSAHRDETLSFYNLQKHYAQIDSELASRLIASRARLQALSTSTHDPSVVRTELATYGLLLSGEAPRADESAFARADTPVISDAPLEELPAATPESAANDLGPKVPGLIGRTRALHHKVTVGLIGFVVAAIGIGVVLRERAEVKESTQRIEAELKAPTSDYRVIKKAELDALKQEIEDLRAKSRALAREFDSRLQIETAKFQRQHEDAMRRVEASSYERGRGDAVGLGMSVREKVGVMTAKKAVVNGECDAFGRGNRIDKVYPVNFAVDVERWVVDPETLKVTGVEATERSLLERKDGPVTYIRCDLGSSDVWPSYGQPVVKADKQARPIGEDGNLLETNPLLR